MNYGIQNTSVLTKFHKGCLAGLDPVERARKQTESWRYEPTALRALSLPTTRSTATPHCRKPNTKATAGSPLIDALQGSTVSELYDGARRIGLSIQSGLRKADLISILVGYVPTAQEQFISFATKVDSAAFEVLLRTLSGETVGHDRHNDLPYYVPNLIPFTFVCSAEDGYASYMPPELQEAIAGIDMNHLAEQRAAFDLVNKALHAYTTLCGIALLEDVYGYLDNGSDRHFDRSLFDQHVATLTKHPLVAPYHLVTIDDLTYVEQRFESSSHRKKLCRHWDDYDYGFEHHRKRLSSTLAPKELIEQHRFVASRLDSLDTCDFDVESYVYSLTCVKDLTSYFDAHVPTGSYDEFFADEMVDELIRRFLFENASLRETLLVLTEEGWFMSEGSNAAPQLTRLICNLYRELPRWELNGWSERECIDMLDAPCLISETLQVYEELDLAS